MVINESRKFVHSTRTSIHIACHGWVTNKIKSCMIFMSSSWYPRILTIDCKRTRNNVMSVEKIQRFHIYKIDLKKYI